MNQQVLESEYGKQIAFWVILALLFLSISLYGYFVNTTILHIVERKSLESETHSVVAHISELETEYLALKRDITPEYAHSLGFASPENVIFAVRGGGSVGLASRE